MNAIRVYFDNVTDCGRVLGDLEPPAEMAAVDELMRLHREGRIKVVNSKMNRIEQQKTRAPETREKLSAHWGELSAVPNDHRLVRFDSQTMLYGFMSWPVLSDIVNEGLFAELTAIGLADSDAKHMMYARENACEYFVTLDTKDILRFRAEIERACGTMRVVWPAELVSALSA
jgi:hypothetical protein